MAFASVEQLLDFLFKQSIEENIVLVLDEYPYLRSAVKGLDSILQSLVDTYRERAHVKLVLCGSHVDVMKSLLEHANPLYGRVDVTISLKAMDYYDSAKFYPGFTAEDKVRLYSVFGGIPYYNRLIDQKKSVRENIIELISEPDSRLENEVSMYIASEISKMTNANEVFGALAKGYSKYRDLLDQSHVSSGPAMVDVLDKLMAMELVQKQAPINDPENKRKSGYRIVDPLSLFYYRYVFRNLSQRAFWIQMCSSIDISHAILRKTMCRISLKRCAANTLFDKTVRETSMCRSTKSGGIGMTTPRIMRTASSTS